MRVIGILRTSSAKSVATRCLPANNRCLEAPPEVLVAWNIQGAADGSGKVRHPLSVSQPYLSYGIPWRPVVFHDDCPTGFEHR